MKVYLYNKDTKIYEGEREARLDILETQKQGKEVYAKPLNATFTAPPEYENGTIPRYIEKVDNWTIVTSNVGNYVINTRINAISRIIEDRPIRSYEVIITEEEYNRMKEEPNKFKLVDRKLVDISGTQEYQNKINIKKYENLILAEKEKYDVFLNTPIKYNGSLYLPRYLDDYEKLQLRAFPQEIWDANGLTSKVMSKADFNGLKSFLEGIVNKAYKEKKDNIKRYKLAIKKLEG